MKKCVLLMIKIKIFNPLWKKQNIFSRFCRYEGYVKRLQH